MIYSGVHAYVSVSPQVQNISQSMEVLDLRTYRDLQYVRNTENLMKVVDGKLKVASENPRSLNPKGFQVSGRLSPVVSRAYLSVSIVHSVRRGALLAQPHILSFFLDHSYKFLHTTVHKLNLNAIFEPFSLRDGI